MKVMQSSFAKVNLFLSLIALTGCSNSQNHQENETSNEESGAAQIVVSETSVSGSDDAGLLIGNEPYSPQFVLDAEGNMNHVGRSLFAKNELLKFHYQRVGCSSDTCKQEFVTYAAVQYPQDSLMQHWMADILSSYYYDVTCQLDIKLNGEKVEINNEGDSEYKNVGCRPYDGVLSDEGKSLFDYYQARVWVIGKEREDEHGPEGRYGCAIYRCWQSKDVASYFVGYSTEEACLHMHCVLSFDRKTGRQLELTDLVKDEFISEFNELLTEAARTRHYQLLKKSSDLSLEDGDCDYSALIQPTAVGLTQEGLAVSTGSLPFDQLSWATHILVLPYERVKHLLQERYRR